MQGEGEPEGEASKAKQGEARPPTMPPPMLTPDARLRCRPRYSPPMLAPDARPRCRSQPQPCTAQLLTAQLLTAQLQPQPWERRLQPPL